MIQTVKSPGATEDARRLSTIGGERDSIAIPCEMESVFSKQERNNLLLNALSRADMSRLEPHLESSTLLQGDALIHAGQRITHVYFPSSAVVGLIITMEDGATAEVGLVGTEGIVNLPVFWGNDKAVYTAIVLQSGHALKMHVQAFSYWLKSAESLRQSLMCYTNLFFGCVAQRAACNGLHSVEKRTASWLLAVRNCSGRDEFHATHEFISFVLGLRRAGVTETLGYFKRTGMLLAHRGRIRIIDAKRLEGFTCECYGIIKAELDRFRNAQSNTPKTLMYANAGIVRE